MLTGESTARMVRGTVIVDEDDGIIAIQVPERGLLGLLRMEDFKPSPGANGQIGTFGANPIPVYVLKRVKRAKAGAAAR